MASNTSLNIIVNKHADLEPIMLDALAQGRQKVFNVVLTLNNGYLADDILEWLVKSQSLDRTMFSLQLTDGGFTTTPPSISEQNSRFHLTTFFSRLGSRFVADSSQKKFYLNLAAQLANPTYAMTAGLYQPPKPASKLSLFSFKKLAAKILRPIFALQNDSTKSTKENSSSIKKRAMNPNPTNWNHALITGWYGTETTGDKAILGEIIHTLRRYNPVMAITITTIDEKVSLQTNYEMGYQDVKLVPIHIAASNDLINSTDAVIMGGGPLMESRQIVHIRNMFRLANQLEKARVIFGCGVGPIHTPNMKEMISEICRLTTAGFFRDEKGKNYGVELGADPTLAVACDPAVAFVARWRKEHAQPTNFVEHTTAFLLREQTKEYQQFGELEGKNNDFSAEIAKGINGFMEKGSICQVELLAMHMYWKGNDDRLFNRQVMERINYPERAVLARGYLDIFSILGRLSKAETAVAMRYHGHLFCLALGIPFISIDYTGKGGKVSSLMNRIDQAHYANSFNDINSDWLVERLCSLRKHSGEIRSQLLVDTEQFIALLEAAYEQNWGKPSLRKMAATIH
jgi:polysaccharide pyruvyl transferase WcaK-like protein